MSDSSNNRRRRLNVMPISRLIPNMVTLIGLCCGLSSLRFAIEGRFEEAVAMVMIAAIIDGMDGRIARMLKATSVFGAQLDSLSDFFCFGVAPVIIAYLWKLHLIKGLGWAVVLFYVVCCALRLARFNTALVEDISKPAAPWKSKFFTGIPSPAGAMLCLLPVVANFYTHSIFNQPISAALWIAIVGALMASRVPTFAVKKFRILHELVLPVMFVFCIYIIMVLVEPWMVFIFTCIGYCISIPFSVLRYRRLEAQHAAFSQALASSPE